MGDVVVDGVKEVGFHDYVWNASRYASGVYIYTIEAKSAGSSDKFSAVKKMMILK